MLRRRSLLLMSAGVACRKSLTMESIAERYVRLVLAVGNHDADYVDAYYGPPAWKTEAAASRLSLEQIRAEGRAILAALESVAPPADAEEMVRLRHRYLSVQTKSVIARAEMLGGKRYTFDEESRALYDAVAPAVGPEQFDKTLAGLEKLIPGEGLLSGRYEAWRKQFYIPPAKLAEVFQAAIDEARARTKAHIALPANESFTVEYVTKQVWSAYNWYKGNSQSLIQVNTDLPTEAKFVLHLACHEGYPGHHVYNALLEDRLVRNRKWVEYTVYPLYSPQSLIAEGSADYGVELAFPHEERVHFLASRIFPLAGLDATKVGVYLEVGKLVEELDHAGNYAARRYLDKEIPREECQRLLEKYALHSPARAGQRVRFIEKNRSYVINYNVGEDLIRAHMKARGVTWQEFEALLSSPRLPSGLAHA
jgi:hypothetical protein